MLHSAYSLCLLRTRSFLPQSSVSLTTSVIRWGHGQFHSSANLQQRVGQVPKPLAKLIGLPKRPLVTMAYTPPPPEHIFKNDLNAPFLKIKDSFEGLSKQQQLYAHYLSRASFFGGLTVLVQTSPESPQIFRLINRIFRGQKSIQELKDLAIKEAGLSEEEFQAYLVYCCAFHGNMGNYKGFGDFKFVPNLPPSKLEALVKASQAFKDDPDEMGEIWQSIKDCLYTLTTRQKQLGLGDKGVTTYFSDNCDSSDAEKVGRYLKSKCIEPTNTRLFKTVGPDGAVEYEIRKAAAVSKVLEGLVEFEGANFKVTTGDYADLMKLTNENLKIAKEHASNDNERAMLQCYIESFADGSVDAHKDGSRYWIKNKGPAVETYIGFIETYRDPVGVRAEFEGFVTMVNKEQSAKFGRLVENAEKFLPRLPWPKELEKDQFLQPDFTSLEVFSFAASGIPAGINIPNYDEIRQSEGFKNVNLGNVISSAFASKRVTFLSEQDAEVIKKWGKDSFELQVGLHELFGHGSGKLLIRNKNGELNFPSDLVNPLTGKHIDKFYEANETYDAKFSSFGSSYEECKAECVALYLSCYNDVVSIFGHEDENDIKDVVYAGWLDLCQKGVATLTAYSLGTKEWKQAHAQARFVILQVLLEAGQGFVSVKEVQGEDGKPDLLLTMDQTKVKTVGKDAIGEFLKKLQIYKSTGDVESAQVMYDHYSEVSESGNWPFARWRDIAVNRAVPRAIQTQANTVIKNEQIEVIEYADGYEAAAQSWVDRFSEEEFKKVDSVLKDLYLKDQPFFTRKD